MIISRKLVEQLNEPAVLRQDCGGLPGCIDGDNGSPVIPRQSGEKQAVVKHQRCIGPWCLHRRGEKAAIPRKYGEKQVVVIRGDKPRDDNQVPARDDCPDGDDCMEIQKRPVTLPGTPQENRDRTSIKQGKELVDIQDNGKNTMIVKRKCGMPGQPACVDGHGIKKQEEPITVPRTSEGKPTLNRLRCIPAFGDFGCIKRKEKGEESAGNQDAPVYQAAPKRRCIPPACNGKPTINRRCAPPDNSGCIDRKKKGEESADDQDAPVYKPSPKRRCDPPFCTGKPTQKRLCSPFPICFKRNEKDEEPADNQNAPVYKPAPKGLCKPPVYCGK